jgi:hypothetical protein
MSWGLSRTETITFGEAVSLAAALASDGENPEYDRGMAELLGDLFPVADVALSDRAEDIGALIREVRHQQNEAGRHHRTRLEKDMSFGYDPEAIYQDADIEQAEMEAIGNRIHQLRKQGVCCHQSVVGYRNPPAYPEQEGLEPGQLRCTDGCGQVFLTTSHWNAAREEAYG